MEKEKYILISASSVKYEIVKIIFKFISRVFCYNNFLYLYNYSTKIIEDIYKI